MRNENIRTTSLNVRILDSLSSQNGALGRQSKKTKCSVSLVLPVQPGTKGRSGKPAPMRCTLLDLVRAVHAVAASEEEVVATVVHLVNSGQVQLCGTFAGAKIGISPTAPATTSPAALSTEPFCDAHMGVRAPAY